MSVSSDRVKKWRKASKQRMVDSMGGKCQCCGYSTCLDALAFHHIDPSKKDLEFGAIRANPRNWKNVVEELRKSILVCHNCHSEIHAGITKIPEIRAIFNEEFVEYRRIGRFDFCCCGKEKPLQNRFCSTACANKNARKVDWDKIDLLSMMEKYTISELEEILGISNAAIYKRRKKILSSK